MDAQPEPAEPLTARRKSFGTALAQKNQQRVHKSRLVDAQNDQGGVVNYSATETFRHRNGRRLVVRQYVRTMTAVPTKLGRDHPAPTSARNARDMQNGHLAPTSARHARNMQIGRSRFDMQTDRPLSDSLRRVKDGAIQKLRRAKNTAVDKLRLARNTTVDSLVWMGNRLDRLIPSSRKLDNTLVGINVALAIALVYAKTRSAHYQALLAVPPA